MRLALRTAGEKTPSAAWETGRRATEPFPRRYQAGFRSLLFLNPATGRAVMAVLNSDNSADDRGSGERLHRIEEAALRAVE